MLKCSELMYCFEIDGTIIDNVPYDVKNYIIRNTKLLSSKCIFNPKKYDIRWNIVTKHSKLDYVFIRTMCLKNGLVPCQIITSKFFNIKDIKNIAYNKLNLFKKILDEKFKVKYTKNKVKRIINVCNDQTENYYINSRRNGYNIISVNIIDFERGFFNEIV